MNDIKPCINCKGGSEVEADGVYVGYMKCGECGFLKSKKNVQVNNVILPDDPMDSFACESCQ